MDIDKIDTLHFLIQELQNKFEISFDDQDIGLCYQILEEEREYINKLKGE
jgi:hypothetical protein